MSQRLRKWFLVGEMVGAVALASLTSGCARKYPMDTLAPHSNLTDRITSLFVEITALDLFVLVVVVVSLFLAIFVFSSRTGEPGEPSAKHSDMFLEMAWTVIPALILLAITIPTVRTIVETQPYRWPKSALTIKVIGHQWWWEFRYPKSGVVTANELHIPMGQEIHLELISDDVIHSFFCPALNAKRDLIPGQVNEITFTANKTGEYYGQCAQFCGTGHANMRFRVFVQTPQKFQAWVKHQLSPPVKPTSGPAAVGAKIFANAPCAICHTIRGVSGFSKEYTYGFRGPDLTHFASRTTFAGSILANNPANVAKWIEDPRAVKPGANMPALGLRGKKVADLVAYLESLK